MNAVTADALKVLAVLLEHVGPTTLSAARSLLGVMNAPDVTEESIAAELKALRAHLAANDETADEALRLRFQT